MVIFESEEAANSMSERVLGMVPGTVTLEEVEVRGRRPRLSPLSEVAVRYAAAAASSGFSRLAAEPPVPSSDALVRSSKRPRA